MKTMMSYSYDPISCVSDVSKAAAKPLGLFGHLRAAIGAWRAERQVRKADAAGLTIGTKATRKLSDLTAAELYEARFDRGDRFARSSFTQSSFTQSGLLRAGDVLSGMVLAWPKPSDKNR
ncbi:hypothetical protein [Thalassospira indica]|uniref:Uncharacterized protein n=1 Tax=Thalassospira indica TaxID=1891279 RepID=A0ABM6Y078_9PROT|nr:hypothetical protein [Thalassospira indica]AXO15321.1 hypothetical protein DY252_14635 [Thalassospira indica]